MPPLLLPGLAQPIDYGHLEGIDALYDTLSHLPSIDTAIGWSLGGQCLIRAIEKGVIKPKRLLLLATPFALDHQFTHFRTAMEQDSKKTLQRFYALVAKGDQHAKAIYRQLCNTPKPEIKHALTWLNELSQFHGENRQAIHNIHTHIIHGKNDHIADDKHALAIEKLFPHSTIALIDQCGHAPHLHNPSLISSYLTETRK